MIRHPDTTQKGTQAPLVARARRDSVLRVRLPLGWPSLPLLRTSSHIILAKCCRGARLRCTAMPRPFSLGKFPPLWQMI